MATRWAPTAVSTRRPQQGTELGRWGSTVVVLAIDAADEAAAAGAMSAAVVDSLHVSGLGHLYPAAVEVEPADDLVAA